VVMKDEGGSLYWLIAQQLRPHQYELHAFESKEQFQQWAKAHPTHGLVEPGSARGKPISRHPIDHRSDLELQ